jgi:Flp pilus assembly pilin Flp
MPDRSKMIRYWAFGGVIAIISSGSLWHYLYNWTGEATLSGLIAPVNESVWEHLKMGYWALVIFSVPEYFFLKQKVNNYFLAKFIGAMTLEITILIIYYSYTFFTDTHIFWIDITSFVTGAFACQVLILTIYNKRPVSKIVDYSGLAAFISIALIFGITTLHPPHLGIFRDKNTDEYGINK